MIPYLVVRLEAAHTLSYANTVHNDVGGSDDRSCSSFIDAVKYPNDAQLKGEMGMFPLTLYHCGEVKEPQTSGHITTMVRSTEE